MNVNLNELSPDNMMDQILIGALGTKYLPADQIHEANFRYEISESDKRFFDILEMLKKYEKDAGGI